MMQLKALTKDQDVKPTRLYLARHGQVADGHTHIYNGHNDVALSPFGVRQFEALAEHWRHLPLAAIYASDRLRAQRGAEIIARDRGLPVQPLPEFRELNFGIWEGLSFAQIAQRYPQELQSRFQDLTNYRIPGGESLADVHARVIPALERLRQRHEGEQFLIVAHAGINRIIICEALGLSLDCLFRLDQAYAGYNIIDYFPDLAVVRLLNATVSPSV
ncbi:MAG: histidine phosphatase family protein [Deltaproteobacteria bacterium]|nr:histidine phosphatase family protein [Deltaproteobacteria bacterium]MBW1985830.1 histidine phosphatase family protein [Deltaproteobacteria bacterium]MBW2133852.1 histidine phosphatase family protein [Deltaproteobacteria bacterium]